MRLAWPSLGTLAVLAWVGNMLYAIGAPGSLTKYLAPALVAIALVTFVLRHGVVRYGGPMMVRFVVTVGAVGWVFETVSVLSGFPFGQYHYTDLMAPFIWHVPVFVLPAYMVMGYASWSLAALMIEGRRTALPAGSDWRVPVLAAGLMVLWDLSMDPLRATVEGRWVWIEGGAHFGVPLSNYLGWLLVTWVMFQAFSLQLRGRVAANSRREMPAQFWVSIPIAYAAFAGEYLLNPFTGHGKAQTVLGPYEGTAQDIFVATAIIALVTLIPAMVLGLSAAVGAGNRLSGPGELNYARARRKSNR